MFGTVCLSLCLGQCVYLYVWDSVYIFMFWTVCLFLCLGQCIYLYVWVSVSIFMFGTVYLYLPSPSIPTAPRLRHKHLWITVCCS